VGRIFLLLFIVINLAAITGFCQQTGIDAEAKLLVNYKHMSAKDKTKFANQRKEQKETWEEDSIPTQFRIPVELLSYRDNASVRSYALFSPKYKTGIGYVPSNLALYYEQEAWRAYKKYGKDAPSLSIVLAQQFTESAFNPLAKGDKGQSTGLPQLYRKTAKLLFKADKDTWKNIFNFDKKGRHFFTSLRMQVRFPFVFLPEVKGYDADHKIEGLRNYNGAGDEAQAYAEKVMRRSLLYEELFAQYNSIPLDTTNFKENLFGMINLTLICRQDEALTGLQMEQLFSNILAEYNKGYIRKTYTDHYRVNVLESDPLSIEKTIEFEVPANGKDYYLVIEDGQVLYNYFADNQQMMNVLANPKNSDFYLYYKKDGKVIKLTNLKKAGKNQIFSNVKPGDKIFIPPGTILKSPGDNLSIVIR
jgi:hypothetical protein